MVPVSIICCFLSNHFGFLTVGLTKKLQNSFFVRPTTDITWNSLVFFKKHFSHKMITQFIKRMIGRLTDNWISPFNCIMNFNMNKSVPHSHTQKTLAQHANKIISKKTASFDTALLCGTFVRFSRQVF